MAGNKIVKDKRGIEDLIITRLVSDQLHIGKKKIDKLDLDWDYRLDSKVNNGREFISQWKPYSFYSSTLNLDDDNDYLSDWHEWTSNNFKEMSWGYFHMIGVFGEIKVLEIHSLEDSLILEDYLLADCESINYKNNLGIKYKSSVGDVIVNEAMDKINKELLKRCNNMYKVKDWGKLKSICDCIYVDYNSLRSAWASTVGFSTMDTILLRKERGEEFQQSFGSRIDWSSYDCETYCWFNLDKLEILDVQYIGE
jgi:hypothetical protein